MIKKLRIAFFGTPDFAVATLAKIVEAGYPVVGVFTAPDKPAGRGMQIQYSDVKKYALKHDLPIYQPEKLKHPDFVELYKSLEIDLAIVVAFRMMPEVIWSAPKIGTLNLHGSLLPNYRGAAPINWALINGETETGVTTFFINNEIDKGAILFQSKCAIEEEDNFGTLYDKLKEIGADLVIHTIESIEKNEYHPKEQNFSSLDRLAPKIDKDLLFIEHYDSCIRIHNLVRGLIPIYKPYFKYRGLKFIIKRGYAEKCLHDETPNSILSNNKDYVKLICRDGFYFIAEIQPEGKKAMDVKSFLNGYKFEIADTC